MDNGLTARLALAFLFFYHGLVPKLIWLSDTERRMIQAHGIESRIELIAAAAGLFEVALALALLVIRGRRWPLQLALGALVVLLLDVAIFAPDLLIRAFGPVTTNVAGIALALVALRETPTRARRPPG